ncbi:sigma 54-interacting transcriptional regulator [Clostridium luticellarii]|jgi:propionate catabolism operon transcriptional regulator|uniref:sigma 54-interacting transcriptional regulator n=1 Tax=Clostridium luticellarii TaxID=1691940 RepID=UPI00235503BD|nr:sigma 54-interacting transcriptional regulator [Clostridium luticellarii]MCI1946395.1 sigma 54-interacting transcriptional regulator [Clostridium luticellarii]MCI1969040.1 sigma 54-interacting transcriptional regulator [Clostridium luticellarii]MCI1996230.1 sigma 54-interacting transcriptional regulator [Clostridium luticellarii]MCI2040531.1 sigma 54-interacting transcriptional regulator [Clostridium luticellarii]
MKQKVAIMSYDRLTKAIYSNISEDILKNVYVINSKFQDTVNIARKLWKNNDIDVFLAGSSNLEMLRHNIPEASIVEIKISGFGIMEDLAAAKQSSDNVAILTYKKPITDFELYKHIFNIDIISKCFDDYDQLKNMLSDLKKAGINTVIGASMVCDICDEIGLNSIFIYSKDSIVSAINYAIQLQKSIGKQKYRNIQLNAILNYAYSGIMATDENNIIQVYNPMAEKIMGISRKDVIGKPVDKTIENTRLDKIMITKREEINQIQRINGQTILTNRVPLVINGQFKGAVATFQDIKSIQNSERKVRREIYAKGLVAKYTFDDIKGKSKVIRESIILAQKYARSDFTVLITGESGTGKELFVNSIHNASRRKNEAFVAVNCAALPENLLESELFGYEGGAFTGAKKGGKIGLFELAHNGTIFLDEIAEMPKSLQSRFLRVIQEKEVMRIGSDKIIPINVRIISATNKNLWQEVLDKKFREDLYYRLNVLELHIPPLRNRREDIPEISRELISKEFAGLYERYRDKWEKIFKVLMTYDFLGNVRELKNVLKRISVFIGSEDYSYFNAYELVNKIYKKEKSQISTDKEAEIKCILDALAETDGNREAAAEKLNISRTTLWRKMKNYGILS